MKKSRGSTQKEKKSEELQNRIKKYKTVGLVEMLGYPSESFEKMKKIFRDKAEFIYTNKVVISSALKKLNAPLKDKIDDTKMPVLLLSNEDPFELSSEAMQNSTFSKLKTGEISEADIVLPAGPTPFPPGPMLSQFSSIGVKTKNESGKISIISDTTIVKKGDKISEKIASILSSMDIRPKELILTISYAFDGKNIFDKKLLYTKKETYISEVEKTFRAALGISLERGIINKYSVSELIKKIYIGVRFLSVNRNIVSSSNARDILAKAVYQANALNKIVGGE
ncbi:MAG: ribosomal protein L10 [Candidatus Parvarchaeum acidophilus ARMAN-5]|jgi:large subunit ribosomal protein L10|uniref:Ribosomal protein L10 n=1 Tax=Candidatus Parvarchaeum acidophilus ARMAN-5 TaxID=662762 RepID=D6GVC8_PARA5|nr:MAG: ribosomal protein L10 [Candidatus Parvarchaeum acidophilus ARMAN-5]